MTEIPPPSISQIPPPIPVDASAFFQNGADYIQVDGDVDACSKVSHSNIFGCGLEFHVSFISGAMDSPCRDDSLH